MSTDAQEPHHWDPEREEAAAEADPDRGSRRWWVIGTALVAVAVALTVWFAVSSTQDAVTATDVGFEHTGEREITMVFDLTREPGTTVSCTITAMDASYGRVGTAQHEVPASQERTTRVRAAVRTTTQAVTATVKQCSAVD
ncbi:DUF4307 domain-containing protein [Janibacter cremeus]|uniref:DUF4307 domain-containing protein n=1 Tax=Janibacter cremeus TaxID=1285192 RepID=A0A852VWB0_9MICO|nr:DUF4307 domain-containing protein [Janibacter cremeus]NYF98933.1 hypothetical protein [Janibacter cremeus]